VLALQAMDGALGWKQREIQPKKNQERKASAYLMKLGIAGTTLFACWYVRALFFCQ